MSKQVKADLMLVLVTAFWGISYLLMDLALTEFGAFELNAFRFLGAFFLAAIAFFPRIKTVNKTTLKYSAMVGFALIFVYIGATFGVMYTSLSNAGFLCALTVVFTPILDYLVFRKKPSKKLFIVLVMAFVGIALLTLTESLKPALGDIICLLCAVSYATDLLITEHAVAHEEVNAFQLGIFQLGFCGAGMLILSLLFETPAFFSKSPAALGSAIVLSIFCTGAAFIVQAIAQQYTSASHVCVIFTLEPVFNSIVAFFIAHEVLRPQAYLGGVLLVASLLVMEIDFTKLLKKSS
ncbi:MAG: DMT family transporter [Firmicutes bacterium]|nr:DMT family transporter [Bacillota bacterium]